MPNHTSFRLNRSGMLLALISAAFAGEAGAAAAGRVDFATAGATIAGRDGQQRPLAKGAELDSGDTVRTDAAGRAQIRFTDGSYVSLQPNTEFAIKDYNFEGKTDGSERGIFGLAKGAMRTVTGLIGRVNRNRYQITTPTATVGIRGTGGRIEVLLDGSTLIAGTSGIWTLTNPSGTLDVPAGTFGKAPSTPNQPPRQSSQGPDTGPAPLPNDPLKPLEPKGIEKQTDPTCQTAPTSAGCINSITVNTTLPPTPVQPLVTGSGYHVSFAYGESPTPGEPDSAINSHSGGQGSLAAATFDAAGKLTQFSAFNNATFSGTHQEFGTAGGVVAWGRWTGPISAGDSNTTTSLNPGTNQGYHYVVGLPATAMPQTGAAAFTFVGATKPTGSSGTIGPGTFSGTLSVTDWSQGTMSLSALLKFAGFQYDLSSGSASFGRGSPAFTGSMNGTASGNIPAGYTCSSICTALINGAFFGPGAIFAGFAYQLTASPQTVSGAAVFRQ